MDNCHVFTDFLDAFFVTFQFLFLTDSMDKEIHRLQDEIADLLPFHWDNDVTVDFSGHFCMCDGKVCNEFTGNPATQRCPLCHKLPKEYRGKKGNLEGTDIKEEAWEAIQELVVAPLHFGLRVFEHLLRLGCMQKFRNKNSGPSYHLRKGEKVKYNKQRKWIQAQFRKRGMRIGFPTRRGM